MFRLKTNKTQLYKLVSNYEILPSMRRVTFAKAHRRPDYRMRWTTADGLRHEVYFAAVGGRAKLSRGDGLLGRSLEGWEGCDVRFWLKEMVFHDEGQR